MTEELLKAFTLIFIAEMGDKTQILAMAFATRFPVKKVLLGIFLGSLLNHGLAVILGSYISSFIPVNTIQIAAGFVFIAFSLWTLKSDDDEDNEEVKGLRYGPVLTVASAFFMGELGDKTQLTAITLATNAAYPLVILCGTVAGMVVTGAMGIIIGKKIGDRVPEFTVKIIAASVFMFFGVSKLYQTVPDQYMNRQSISLFAGVLSILLFMTIRPLIIRRNQGIESLFKIRSRELYNYYKQAEENINEICLGEPTCGECQGSSCLIGSAKILIKEGLGDVEQKAAKALVFKGSDKQYDKEKVLESLKTTLILLRQDPGNADYQNIHEIRKKLEIILFKKSIDNMDSWEEYKQSLLTLDKTSALRLFESINR